MVRFGVFWCDLAIKRPNKFQKVPILEIFLNLRNFLVCFGVFWHALACFDMFWGVLTCFGVFWGVLMCFGVFRHVLACFVGCWSVL